MKSSKILPNLTEYKVINNLEFIKNALFPDVVPERSVVLWRTGGLGDTPCYPEHTMWSQEHSGALRSAKEHQFWGPEHRLWAPEC
jgi:hypothetical protein